MLVQRTYAIKAEKETPAGLSQIDIETVMFQVSCRAGGPEVVLTSKAVSMYTVQDNLAGSFSCGDFKVFSAIERREGLQIGKSYYYQEIERILEFLKLPPGNRNNLFLIDEIYRGTNTAERLAAATVVLDELAKKGIVLATTHDIELSHSLKDSFSMVHFREEVNEGRHYFTYRLHQGPCRSRNAIRLLELVGYPAGLIEKALALIKP